MPDYFYDTSALTKHYHVEPGTAAVNGLLARGGRSHGISRQTVVEFHPVFAKKVRSGQLSRKVFESTVRRFQQDLRAKRYEVVRVTVAHYESAARLIRRLGPLQNLRTLDALQLAVTLSLNEPARPVAFVCADQALCGIAAAEGLTVMNSEVP